jgi:hypothetical protein
MSPVQTSREPTHEGIKREYKALLADIDRRDAQMDKVKGALIRTLDIMASTSGWPSDEAENAIYVSVSDALNEGWNNE